MQQRARQQGKMTSVLRYALLQIECNLIAQILHLVAQIIYKNQKFSKIIYQFNFYPINSDENWSKIRTKLRKGKGLKP